MSTEERVSYRDKLAEAMHVANCGCSGSCPGGYGEMADAVLAVFTCGASNTGLIPETTLGPCILRIDHDGPVHEAGDGVRWSLGGAVRDAELDRLSQESTRLAAELAREKRQHSAANYEVGAQMARAGAADRAAGSAEAQLAEAKKKIENLSARFTGVKIHALRLRERITDPDTVTVLDDLFGALTNPPPGDTP